MSKFTQPTRSVRDIKTLAGKADDLLTPHKMYMRLFALETERHRRVLERTSAMVRVANIDARCAEIDQEKERLLSLLGVEALPVDCQTVAGAPDDGISPSGGAGPSRIPRGDPRRTRARAAAQMTAAQATVAEPVKIRY